jgi:O-antigen/teichoic acid export membrane protein
MMGSEANGPEAPVDAPLPTSDSPSPAGGPGPNSRAGIDRTFRSMSRGTSVMAIATLCVVFLQFLTRVLVTRHVSAADWGEFNLGLSLASLLALIAAFGIPTATARAMAYEQTYEARMALVRKALYVSIPVAVAGTVLVYYFADAIASVFNGNLADVFRLFALSIGFTMMSNVLAGIFQGLERAEANALFVQILNPALFLAFTSGFLLAGWGFEGVVWGYVLSWMGAFGALAVYSYRRLPPMLARLSDAAFTGDATGRVSFATLSITLFGVAALTYVTSYADTLLLGIFRAPALVGQYSSAMNLNRLLLVGTGTVTFIYLPITARLRREKDFAGLRETYVTVTRWMALLTVPLSYIFFFDPALSLAFTFGKNQVGGAEALQILVLANTLAIVLGPAVATLGGLGEVRQVLVYMLVSAVANIVLCFTLIPQYGLVGAAVAWSIARVIYQALAVIRIYRVHGITPFASHFLRPTLLSTAILVPLFIFVVPHPTTIWIPLLLVLPFVGYAGSILVTRSVDQGDLHFVRAAEKKFGGVVTPLRRLLESRATAPPETLSPTGPP